MGRYLLLFVATFVFVVVFLKWLVEGQLLELVGVGLLAAGVALVVAQLLHRFLPKSLLPHLQNRAVFVTGCDTGFGNRLARELDSLKVTVYAGCLFSEGPGAQELKRECSNRLHIVQLDVTKEDSVAAAVKYVKSTIGEKDFSAVVNNAGIVSYAEIEWVDVKSISNMIDVNTLGPIRVSKAFLPMLRKSKGRIVNIVSLAGRFTIPGLTCYSISKHAAIAFTDGLRNEMKKFSVSVHSIEPTIYSTPMVKIISSSLDETWNKCPKEIQDVYGVDYKNSLQKVINMGILIKNSSIEPVINSMVDASIGESPQSNYVPSAIGYLQYILVTNLPLVLRDSIFSFLLKIIRK